MPSSSTICGDKCRAAVLSIITGRGKWVEITIAADCLYQHYCSRPRRNSGAASRVAIPPRLFGWNRHASYRGGCIVDMSTSNAWAELPGILSDPPGVCPA